MTNYFRYLTKADINSGSLINSDDSSFRRALTVLGDRNLPILSERTVSPSSNSDVNNYNWQQFLNPYANSLFGVTNQNYNLFWYDTLLGSQTNALHRYRYHSGDDVIDVRLITVLSSDDDADDTDELWGLVEIVEGRGVLENHLGSDRVRLQHVDANGDGTGAFVPLGRVQTVFAPGITTENLYAEDSNRFVGQFIQLWHNRIDSNFHTHLDTIAPDHVLKETIKGMDDNHLEIFDIVGSVLPNVRTRFYSVVGRDEGIVQKQSINNYTRERLPVELSDDNKVDRTINSIYYPIRKIKATSRVRRISGSSDLQHTLFKENTNEAIALDVAAVMPGTAVNLSQNGTDYLVYIKDVSYENNYFTTKLPTGLTVPAVFTGSVDIPTVLANAVEPGDNTVTTNSILQDDNVPQLITSIEWVRGTIARKCILTTTGREAPVEFAPIPIDVAEDRATAGLPVAGDLSLSPFETTVVFNCDENTGTFSWTTGVIRIRGTEI